MGAGKGFGVSVERAGVHGNCLPELTAQPLIAGQELTLFAVLTRSICSSRLSSACPRTRAPCTATRPPMRSVSFERDTGWPRTST